MRILFWTDWFLPSIGGVEIFSARLLPALVRRGYDVTVIAGHHTSGLPDVLDWEGVTVCRLPFHAVLASHEVGAFAATLRRVVELKQEARPDVVHLNTLGPSVLFHLETTARHPAPVLLTMHSPVMPDARRLDTLYGRALHSADQVNCNSGAVLADLRRLAPGIENATVTYYGMDPPSRTPSPRPHQPPVILCYGRLVEDKGFDLAIRALADVRRRQPAAELVIAGDGAARAGLLRQAADLGLTSAVSFLGSLAPDAIPPLLDRASIVLVPSRWSEPFGLVALEAALMARPVVAARVGGLAEVVEHGVTGLLVDAEDPISLGDATLSLLEDVPLADRMGVSARERALARFSWQRCVDEYDQLYRATARTHLVGGAA